MKLVCGAVLITRKSGAIVLRKPTLEEETISDAEARLIAVALRASVLAAPANTDGPRVEVNDNTFVRALRADEDSAQAVLAMRGTYFAFEIAAVKLAELLDLLLTVSVEVSA